VVSTSRRVHPRRAIAVNAGKFAALASRALRRGGGTAFPGVVATRVDPSIARDLSLQLDCGSIAVSGTNGKTTTSRLLAGILTDAGFLTVRNDEGSNLMRGVASSLVRRANVLGNLPGGTRSLGLFEVDEAALPGVLQALVPGNLLLLNLFRDQLDRYGEVATIARIWSSALRQLPTDTRLTVNADDPLLVNAAGEARGEVLYFGIDSGGSEQRVTEHASDVKSCPRCGGPIEYSSVFLGHLGHYACTRCDLQRPEPRVVARDVDLRGVDGSAFVLHAEGQQAQVSLPLPGMYNVYNATAAAAVAVALGISPSAIAASLARATPAFGRMEQIAVAGRQVFTALAKNPAGLNEVMRTITQERQPLHALVMLNDNVADGHDVSWIWDADVEMLAGQLDSVVFSGTRGPDMALRFKYAQAINQEAGPAWEIVDDTESAFRRALEQTPMNGRLFVLPTYTAMLDVRGVLTRLGHVKAYWEA
jgi:UDP-N-acetylmuramyl tripeptide synthase